MPKPPRSYDEIVRTTVPLPDSSHRPTKEEARAAADREPGPRILGEGSHIHDVRAALDALVAADLTDLDVTISDGRVVLDGSVATADDRQRIVAAVEPVVGVHAVLDRLRARL